LLTKDGSLVILVATKSDDTAKPLPTALQALDSVGRLKWQFDLPTKPQASREQAPSELGYGLDGTLLVAYTGLLHALTSDGKLKWTMTLPDKPDKSVGRDTRITTAQDGSIYLGLENLVVKATKDGVFQWERVVPGYWSGPLTVGKDGSVYLGASDFVLYAIGPDGTTRFKTDKHPDGGSTDAMAVGTDGTIYLWGGNAPVLLFAIDAQGSTKWILSGAMGTGLGNLVLDATDTIFVADTPRIRDEGRLRAVRSDRTIRWDLKFVEKHYTIYSVAIGGNGLLYVQARRDVLCLEGPMQSN
jgi:outer membrane protein assembly factor BamB